MNLSLQKNLSSFLTAKLLLQNPSDITFHGSMLTYALFSSSYTNEIGSMTIL